jgi:hypothetical protein
MTVEGAFGPGGAGVFGNPSVLYERPVRGVGVGDDCCAAIGLTAMIKKTNNPAIEDHRNLPVLASREKHSFENIQINGNEVDFSLR